MGKSIDERIVEMEFDNSNFEKNVQTSISTLDRLKNALNLDGAAEGLSHLGNVTSAIGDVNGLGAAVETVKSKFNALEVIATGALLKIGSQAVEAGERMVKSLATDQINAGWDKYADKTTSVQTIMAATADQFENQAEQMEYVNEQLDKLNWFTDETSYNFVDMTNNIGKFTSQGIKLEDAVTAMEGISVWAAQSGQNAQAASRAMYNLSQALGVGAVKLQDWKSIENANMATKEFKEIAIAAGIAAGAISEGQVTIENFSQSLSDSETKGWFSADILMDVLKQYGSFTDALHDAVEELNVDTTSELLEYLDSFKNGTLDVNSTAEELGVTAEKLTETLTFLGESEFELGRKSFKSAQEAKTFAEALDATKDAVSTAWMNIFETIFGNYLEAKQLWTDLANYLYDVFAQPVNDLGELLSSWADAGGRTDLLEAFANIGRTIAAIIDTIKDAWRDVFPPKTGEQLAQITANFKEFTANILNAVKNSTSLQRIFKGVFSVLSIGVKTIKTIIKLLSPLFKVAKSIAGVFLDIAASVGDFITALDKGTSGIKIFAGASKRIDDLFNSMTTLADELDYLVGMFYDGGGGISGFFNVLGAGLKDALGFVLDLISAVTGIDLSAIKNGLMNAINAITKDLVWFDWDKIFDVGSAIETMKNVIKNAFSEITGWYSDAGGGITGIVNVIYQVITGVLTKIIDKIESITGWDLSGMLDTIVGALTMAKDKVTEFVDSFKQVDKANESLSLTYTLLTGIRDIFGAAISGITTIIQGIANFVANNPLIAAFATIGLMNMSEISSAIKSICDFIKDLANGGNLLKQVAQNIGQAFDGLIGAFGKLETGLNPKNIMLVALSIGILAGSLWALSTIPIDNLAVRFGILTAAMGELVGAMEIIARLPSKGIFDTTLSKAANSMIKLSIAAAILSKCLKEISSVGDWNSLAIGMAGLTAVLGELGIALEGLNLIISSMNYKAIVNLRTVATSLILVAAAIGILSNSLVKISAINNWNQIAQGLLGITVMLGELGLFAKLVSSTLSPKTGIALMGVALAVGILADAIVKLQELNPEQLKQGFNAVTGCLFDLFVFVELLGSTGMTMSAAVGILAIAVAMNILTGALTTLGSMSMADISKAMLELGLTLFMITTAANALPAGLIQAGLGFMIMAIGVKVLSDAIYQLSSLNIEQIGAALIGITGSIMVLCIALQNMNGNIAGAAAFTIAATGLIALSAAIAIISALNPDQLVISLVALTGAMAALVVACNAMNGAIAGAAAMTVVSVAMLALSAAIVAICAVPFDVAIGGIIAMVGAIGAFAACAVLLAPALVPMLALGATLAAIVALVGGGLMIVAAAIGSFAVSIQLISVSAAAAAEGIGLLGEAFGKHLASFLEMTVTLPIIGAALLIFGAAALVAGAGATVLAVGIIALGVSFMILAAGVAVLNLVSDSMSALAENLVEFCTILATSTQEIIVASAEMLVIGAAMLVMAAGAAVLGAALIVLGAGIDVLAIGFGLLSVAIIACAVGLTIVSGAVETLATYGATAAEAIVAFAAGLAKAVPSLTKSANDIKPLADNLTTIANTSTKLAVNLALVVVGFVALSATLSDNVTKMNELIAANNILVTSIIAMSSSLNGTFNNVFTNFSNMLVNMNNLLVDLGTKMTTNSKVIAENIYNQFKAVINTKAGIELGKFLMVGLGNGINSNKSHAINAAKKVGAEVKSVLQKTLEVHSPSRFGIWLGKMLDFGFGGGIDKYSDEATDAAEDMGYGTLDAMRDSLKDIGDVLGMDLESDPIITPVLDLSNIQNGLSDIDSMMAQRRAADISANFNSNRMDAYNADLANQMAMSRMNSDLLNALNMLNRNDTTPVEVNVVLEGDADGIFNLVKSENSRYMKQTGRSPLYG